MPGSVNASRHLARALYQHRQDPSEASSVWGMNKVLSFIPFFIRVKADDPIYIYIYVYIYIYILCRGWHLFGA